MWVSWVVASQLVVRLVVVALAFVGLVVALPGDRAVPRLGPGE
jgi:hypothetical protein